MSNLATLKAKYEELREHVLISDIRASLKSDLTGDAFEDAVFDEWDAIKADRCDQRIVLSTAIREMESDNDKR